ncbi:MAG: glycosyltransferase WbuB [Actinobacteria bacterium]|nr:MAG: glycosyltransferase WbuB [Actinomycetota bacterium]
MRLVVLCPHFAPDMAPTGAVMTRIVAEMAELGHELHVVTSLPWYREHAIESGWGGKLWRVEKTSWGSITRVHPFPGKTKRNLLRRALGFVLFSAVVGLRSLVAGGLPRRIDGVLAMSPPLTLGLTGWFTKMFRGGMLVFNIQDIFPDAAAQTGAITNKQILSTARWLERVSYERSDAVVLLSQDLERNVAAKLSTKFHDRLHVIPNFVDTKLIVPGHRMTVYRSELGIDDRVVVMYAGNVGFSQSLELMIAASKAMPEVAFVINGDGAARKALQVAAKNLGNVYFADYQPIERLSEVLASGDIHVVPLKTGLASVSVPSKMYSILAAGRPVVGAIDPDTEIPRTLASSGAGLAVKPDDEAAFIAALQLLISDRPKRAEMGALGRTWVEHHASAAAIAKRYEAIYLNNR